MIAQSSHQHLSKLNTRNNIRDTRESSDDDSPVQEKASSYNKKNRHINNRLKTESVRNKSLSLLLDNYSYKSQDTNAGQSPESSDWDINLDTILTSDTIDTDEFEAELKRQKRKNKREKKHKRSKKLKKRKRKRARSYSSVESLLENDIKEAYDSSREYELSKKLHSKSKASDGNRKRNRALSKQTSGSPVPTRTSSRNSYYSGSTNLSPAVDNVLLSTQSTTTTTNTLATSTTATVKDVTCTGSLPNSMTTFSSKRRFGTSPSHRRRSKYQSPHTPPLYTKSRSLNSSSCDIRASSRSTPSSNRGKTSRYYSKHSRRYRSLSGSETASSTYYRNNKYKYMHDDRKRKDAARYHHQISTPPHKKQKKHDMRSSSIYNTSNDDRINNRSSSRYMKDNHVYYKENYLKRLNR